jgi:SpoVK/Ycf46/Vps4 family AAA+-type ATPase
MAKAVATETGATFINVDSASISSKWYGEAEKMARAVFTLARKLAPTVIFIDEIDSLLSARDDTERSTIASVKTTLMREWDGLGTGADRVLVIGATNRPYVLDEAILRRMPRRIMVDLPMVDERVAILKVGLEGNRLGPDVDLKELAGKLEQYSGSDIRELCREAIVSISNARARELEELEAKGETVPEGMLRLRAAKMADFEEAMKRIRPSVPKDSSMRKRVQEWNEQFGEGGTGKHASLDHIYS